MKVSSVRSCDESVNNVRLDYVNTNCVSSSHESRANESDRLGDSSSHVSRVDLTHESYASLGQASCDNSESLGYVSHAGRVCLLDGAQTRSALRLCPAVALTAAGG